MLTPAETVQPLQLVEHQIEHGATLISRFHNEEGSTKTGFVIGLGSAAALLAGVLYMKGALPSFSHEERIHNGPATITKYYQLDETCYAGYEAESSSDAKVQATVKTGNIPFIDTGLHASAKFPGAWISETVAGPTDVDICQLNKEIKTVYNKDTHKLHVEVPNDAIIFKAGMPADRRITQPDGGILSVGTETLNEFWRVFTEKGLPNHVNSVRDGLEQAAEMQNVQSVVEKCTPLIQSRFESDFRRKNIDAMVKAANIFGINLTAADVDLQFTGQSPKFDSRYAATLKELDKDPKISIESGAASSCNVSPEFAVQLPPNEVHAERALAQTVGSN